MRMFVCSFLHKALANTSTVGFHIVLLGKPMWIRS